MENNGENSGPLTSLPVDRLTATDCNAAARANKFFDQSNFLFAFPLRSSLPIDRLTATDCNAAARANIAFWNAKELSYIKVENNDGNSGHYVIASRPPYGDRLQRRRSCQ